ncbi:MAG: SGNH/GDSL hydrolase family protein [Chloroflexi bacterium]|nr:SGNH/GDSL hydrolase family protein [Chloroflexota bacterium]MCI0574993.1 SGNH/GDSL hydrolase family protein [Chloroflexota bacterium]MCI0645779.1 SGNH/GDSL hydrolase family protein [Chloroflexota bacterium]MCI0727706.1 SGNH/GDSL hydrolase family protein [Chloroflexota bacterium]
MKMVVGLLKRAALVVTGLVMALLILEVIARVLHLGTGGFWEPHPLYGWRNIPNAAGWESCYGECNVYVEINSRGLRDQETAYEKELGQQRILFLGDSLTAGMQVPLEDTFSKILEQQLNNAGGNNDWMVINAAVNGYGTDNELLFFRQEASKYQPDIVILGVYLANDIYNNSYELEVSTGGNRHKPYFELDDTGALVLKNYPVEGADNWSVRVSSFFKRYFQLPRFIAQTLNLRRDVPAALRPLVELAGGRRAEPAPEEASAPAPRRRLDICVEQYAPKIEEAWAITRVLLRQMRLEVEASGARFVVLVIPAAPQVIPPAEGESWYCQRPNDELAAFLTAEGVPFLDLLEPFRAHMLQGGPALYYQKDFHMNELGHRLAGEELYHFVSELPPAP